MIFNIFLFGFLFAAGLFFVLADLLRLPTLAAEKAMLSAGRSKKTARKTLETLRMKAAVRASQAVRMDAYRRRRMANTLAAAGIDMTPEVFLAYAVTQAGAIALLAVPSLMVLPLLAPVLVFLAVLIYFKAIRSADEKLKAKREGVEKELPRFVATLTQALSASRDVLGMLDGYRNSAGEPLAGELDVLTADMRSSSYEAALVRFEARVGSPMLSDVVRGLIGVLRGDDGAVYFRMLSHDMKQLELQRLKAEAVKIPPKVRKYSFVMLMCFLMTYTRVRKHIPAGTVFLSRCRVRFSLAYHPGYAAFNLPCLVTKILVRIMLYVFAHEYTLSLLAMRSRVPSASCFKMEVKPC